MYRSLSVLLLAALASLSVACSADAEAPAGEDVGVDEVNASGKVAAGKFKLYAPGTVVDKECDVHTKLELKANGAALSEALAGTCELMVLPNARSYSLKRSNQDGCGSSTYKGTTKIAGKPYAIEITDNRMRTCEDLILGTLVVKETVPNRQGGADITTTKVPIDSRR